MSQAAETVSVALTPELITAMREAVESGDYVSSSEVMCEALRDWRRRRSLQQKEVEELQRIWKEGLASGPGSFGDMAAIKVEARRRLDSIQATKTKSC
ncbi:MULTISPECIES: ribbon-helix-helix domain-containing protein [Thiorhodovibrio]|uniref:ribbon-helix-helix domain-containing protein n=1 Tax=Thiorhodovibrio TaxID=61593 RepID=UPI001914C447|nr:MULTISPECIES: type II toxin-antitoxin system ParD family antitoxin [Thiorhodovibrio]MBK5967773.1 addiction module antidote protein [Thiorhodovibrio winogradskyi]WPL14422.1 putative addiction module antidote protein, family [Thiorhodovibrio litoralis]